MFGRNCYAVVHVCADKRFHPQLKDNGATSDLGQCS